MTCLDPGTLQQQCKPAAGRAGARPCRAGPPGAEKRSTQESLTRRHTEGGPLRAALLQRDEGRRRGGAGAAPLLSPPLVLLFVVLKGKASASRV